MWEITYNIGTEVRALPGSKFVSGSLVPTQLMSVKILILTSKSLHIRASIFLDNCNFPIPSSKRGLLTVPQAGGGFSTFTYSGFFHLENLSASSSLWCSEPISNAIQHTYMTLPFFSYIRLPPFIACGILYLFHGTWPIVLFKKIKSILR